MTQPILSLDVESRSTVDLRKAGAHRYWEDPDTALWCACYAFDDEPVQSWVPGQSCPPRIREHVEAGGIVSAWNAQFERLAWRHCLVDVHGWPVTRLEQFEDTAAWAGAMALPRALGQAAQALGTDAQKDDEGHRLMMRMAKPRKARKGEDPTKTYWWDDEDRLQRLILYCKDDVETERAIRRKLLPLSSFEREVFLFDQRMNDRGVFIDVPFVDALLKITEQTKTQLDKEMKVVTSGAVTACSQVKVLTEWLSGELCFKLDSLDKNAIASLLEMPDIPDHARRALELRQQAAKSSTAKLNAMKACVGDDSRGRGFHLYHGASTGRWAGRLVQCQNMPRGTGTVKDPDTAAQDMLTGDTDFVDFMYGPPMSAVSDCLRACLTASPGNRLLVADYSSIEGRVTAWLAGEHDEIDAYRAVDAGTGAGIYEIAAGSIFNVNPFEVKKHQRQVGKAATLALGYAGGVMAFKSMADIYGIDMAPVYPILRQTADPDLFERACESHDRWKESGLLGTGVLPREAWIASEVTKLAWREKHPATVALWEGLENAAFDAADQPGSITSYGGVKYIVRRGFLWCQLPSGRCLAYGAPKIAERSTPWGDKKPAVTALGVDSVTRKWRRFALYGGLATENCLSGTSEVLTDKGWRGIQTVDSSSMVWDGQEWVRHDGCIYQGERETINFGGLHVTPDHKIWTVYGWRAAAETYPEETASPGVGPDRPTVRASDRDSLRRLEREEESVAHALRLRGDENTCGVRTKKGANAKLRLPPSRGSESTRQDARDVKRPGLRGVAQHDRPLSTPVASCIRQVRRARNHCLQSVAQIVSSLLGRHGAELPSGVDDRAGRQRQGLFTKQLHLGRLEDAGPQHSRQSNDRNATGPYAFGRSLRVVRDRGDHAGVPPQPRLAGGEDVRHPRHDEPRVEPVFDLLNAGPRHRFVARGGPDQPAFIVSNCVQAIARDLIAVGMLNAEREGYPIVLTVHDEAVADTPRGHGSLEHFSECLCDMPAWADGLPVVADGYEAIRYRKE